MAKNMLILKLALSTLIGLSLSLQSGCQAMNKRPEADQALSNGQALYRQQDYHAAYQQLLYAAQRGQAQAQYAVGYMLYNGIGVTRDQNAALGWFMRSAKKGYPKAAQALKQMDEGAKPSY